MDIRRCEVREMVAMIEPWVTQELCQIERGLRTDDPHFVDGFRRGSPCPPREYRRSRRWRLLAAVLALALVTGLVVGALAMQRFIVVSAVTGALVGGLATALSGRALARRRLPDRSV